MAKYTKGQSGNRQGRPKGAANLTTREVREAYQLLVEKNIGNLEAWLKKIAEKDPNKAFDIVLRLSEYFIPKMTRTEITGEGGTPLYTDIKVEIIKPNEDTDYGVIREDT